MKLFTFLDETVDVVLNYGYGILVFPITTDIFSMKGYFIFNVCTCSKSREPLVGSKEGLCNFLTALDGLACKNFRCLL